MALLLTGLTGFAFHGYEGLPSTSNASLPFEHRVHIQVERNNVILSIVPLLFLEQAGVALFDADQDGFLDVYLTNGPGFDNALLRNVNGDRFEHIGASSGVDYPGGTAAVAGDFNNDGYIDLFVARRNKNVLYLNEGNGHFADISAASGIGQDLQLTLNAAWCDFDNDGWLDLYLGNRRRHSDDVLHPNQLFRNNGDLTFTEMAQAAGVDNPVTRTLLEPGRGQNSTMALSCWDYDLDGDQDLAVAVDFATVTLFQNQWQQTGQLVFKNVTNEAGLGLTGNWMGLAIGDFNGDALPDLFASSWGSSANIYNVDIPVESPFHALYLNRGDGSFKNMAEAAGVARWEFGWGAVALDWENDGDLDLYYVGNMVEDVARPVRDNPGHLFINDGTATFTEASSQYDLANVDEAGVFQIGHGVATGDFDDDGFFDIVVANSAYRDREQNVIPGIPKLFLNRQFPHEFSGHWLKVNVVGTASNRSGIGARILIWVDGNVQTREVQSGNGHMGQNSLETGFGLGAATRVQRLEVHWPSGALDRLEDLGADQTVTVVEGQHPAN